jgi:hypothetical protein
MTPVGDTTPARCTLDQKRRLGYVWIRIVWQTGSTSEAWFQRTVQG